MRIRIIIEFEETKQDKAKLLKEIELLTMQSNPFDEPLIYVESKRENDNEWKLEAY